MLTQSYCEIIHDTNPAIRVHRNADVASVNVAVYTIYLARRGMQLHFPPMFINPAGQIPVAWGQCLVVSVVIRVWEIAVPWVDVVWVHGGGMCCCTRSIEYIVAVAL